MSCQVNYYPKLAFTYTLARPDGTLLFTNNITAFCKECNFVDRTFAISFKLNRPIPSGKAKGWQLISRIPIIKPEVRINTVDDPPESRQSSQIVEVPG
jgi:hypothetical protein